MNKKVLEKLSKMSEREQRVGKKSKVTNTYNYIRPVMAGAYNTENGDLTIATPYWYLIAKNTPTTDKMAVAPKYDDSERINFRNIAKDYYRKGVEIKDFRTDLNIDKEQPRYLYSAINQTFDSRYLTPLLQAFDNEQNIKAYSFEYGLYVISDNLEMFLLPLRSL